MNTIKAFFQIIRAIFSISKKGREDPLPPLSLFPANCAPDTSSDMHMHPKNIALYKNTLITQ